MDRETLLILTQELKLMFERIEQRLTRKGTPDRQPVPDMRRSSAQPASPPPFVPKAESDPQVMGIDDDEGEEDTSAPPPRQQTFDMDGDAGGVADAQRSMSSYVREHIVTTLKMSKNPVETQQIIDSVQRKYTHVQEGLVRQSLRRLERDRRISSTPTRPKLYSLR